MEVNVFQAKKKKEFDIWDINKREEKAFFIMHKDLRDYCWSDVSLLKRCCLQFRKDIMMVTKK